MHHENMSEMYMFSLCSFSSSMTVHVLHCKCPMRYDSVCSKSVVVF